MITFLVRWLAIVVVPSFLLPVIGWVHTSPESLSQIHNVFLPLIKNDPILMAYVPQGEFMMGCYPAPGDCYIDDDHLHAVWLDSCWIDKFEVTNAQYAKCVEEEVAHLLATSAPIPIQTITTTLPSQIIQ